MNIDVREIEFYIEEFEKFGKEIKNIRNLTEADLIPIYDTMTQLFDD